MDNLEPARTQAARHIQLMERNPSGELVGKSAISTSGGGPGLMLASREKEELNSAEKHEATGGNWHLSIHFSQSMLWSTFFF